MVLLARGSDKNMIRLTYLAERITKRDHYLRQIRKIRTLFEEGNPALEVAKRIIRQSHPHHRKRAIRTFVINQLLVGSNKRKEFSEREGFYPPGFFLMSPTMKCNLRCQGCYAASYSQEEELSFEVIDRIIKEANEMGMYYVCISGGEPFLREDIFDIFKKHKNTAFMVYTNGTLIDEGIAQRLLEVGNVLTCLSVEGFEAETDGRRGKGTFAKVMKAMDTLRKKGVLFAFSTTLTRKNAEVVTSNEFIDMLIEKGCVVGWYFLYTPVGHQPDWNLVPTPQQRALLLRREQEIRDTRPILLASFFIDGTSVGGCIAAGRRYFHINNKGDVEPCVFTHFAVDNVKEKSLREVLDSSFFRALRARQPHDKNLLRTCPVHDHPEVLREVVASTGAHPTHPGAEQVITKLAPQMDAYAKEWAKVADPLWEKQYKKKAEAKNRRST
jgi:MoaA/NifB/PqqE/SkfB family radical SAM enzyme